MTAFAFLREPGESHNEALARCAEQILAAGPMSFDQRRHEHEQFLEDTVGRGRDLLWNIHSGPGTECAVFVGACAIAAGVVPKHGWPKAPAITTWTGLGGFGSKCWMPFRGGKLMHASPSVSPDLCRGDVPYWCGGTAQTWPAAFNGHVEILARGDKFAWITAAGGGGADGSRCAISGPKDVRDSWGRPLRGVWRPSLLTPSVSPTSDTEPAPPPSSSQPPPVWVPPSAIGLKLHSYGDTVRAWQARLVAAGYPLPRSTRKDGSLDGDFGAETEAATRAVQRDSLLPQTGVVDRKTWEHAEARR